MITLNIVGVPQSKPQTKPIGGGLKKLAPPPGFKQTHKTEVKNELFTLEVPL
jgi:hypothetical protein